MSVNNITNMAASVRQRLLNLSRNSEFSFHELLQYYAMERLLYRLSVSPHAGKYILKGALLLRVWQLDSARSTMDIDLLGITGNSRENIIAQMAEIIQPSSVDDGLIFDEASIDASPITEESQYVGQRVKLFASLGTAKIRLQLDIGIGDSVYPTPKLFDLPSILDFPPPSLLCYQMETSIAEKFSAMVVRRELNSRMKDFYDIWLLLSNRSFDAMLLGEAIKQTFLKRNIELSQDVPAFLPSFAELKQVEWTAFRKKLKSPPPQNFAEVIERIRIFLEPISLQLAHDSQLAGQWNPGGPWEFNE